MTIWRDDPALKDHFHPDFPDDVQVLVHDGSFRFTDKHPELMWVHIIARMETVTRNGDKLSCYKGILLNQPHHLQTIKLHQEIYFFAYENYKYPIRAIPAYLASRPQWVIVPCDNCGLPEVFDPIPDLIKVTFPNTPEGSDVLAFASFCPICGKNGRLMLSRRKEQENENKNT